MTATENKKTKTSELTDEITKLLEKQLFDHEVFEHEEYEYNENKTYYDYDPITKERVKKTRTVRRRGIN